MAFRYGIAALSVAALASVPAMAEPACPADPAVLEAVLQGHGAAIRRGDMAAIMADFAPGARIVGPGSDLNSNAEIRRQTEEALESYEMNPDNRIDSVEFLGVWAIQEGPYSETARDRETGEEANTQGTWLALYRCDEAAGVWQFFRIMWQQEAG